MITQIGNPRYTPGNFAGREVPLDSIGWLDESQRAALYGLRRRGVTADCYRPLGVDPYAIDIHCEGIALRPDGRSHTQVQVALDKFIENFAAYCRILTGDTE